MGVAQLDPPTYGTTVCGPAAWVGNQSRPVYLSCGPGGGQIVDVAFASYGQPTGTCPNFAASSTCNAPDSLQVVKMACVGSSSCTIPMSYFTDPCPGQPKWLAVAVTCQFPAIHTVWDFQTMDEFMLPFWSAVGNASSTPIISWSTPPTWMYDANRYTYPDDPATWDYGYYSQGIAPASNLTQLGDYYGRVAAWYMRGGFVDEAGTYRMSRHNLSFSIMEIVRDTEEGQGYDDSLTLVVALPLPPQWLTPSSLPRPFPLWALTHCPHTSHSAAQRHTATQSRVHECRATRWTMSCTARRRATRWSLMPSWRVCGGGPIRITPSCSTA